MISKYYLIDSDTKNNLVFNRKNKYNCFKLKKPFIFTFRE